VDALQPIETAEALLSTKDLDIIRTGFEGLAHGHTQYRFDSRLAGSE